MEKNKVYCKNCKKLLFEGTEKEIKQNIIYCEKCAEDKILYDIEQLFKKHSFDVVDNYFNGQFTFWAMNKNRDTSINIIFNHPDEETIKEFEEHNKNE